MPQLLASLGDADVVGLEGVEGDAEGDGGKAESPHGEGADLGDAVLGEVVDDAGPALVLVLPGHAARPHVMNAGSDNTEREALG